MNMHDPSETGQSHRAKLSALMDGHLSDVDIDGACATWRVDAQVRECWHTYHLIGDVLRSGELASDPAHAQAFLAGVRERLGDEPVPFSPAAISPSAISAPVVVAIGRPTGRMRAWAPIAAAAGVAAVAGVLVVMRTSGPGVAPAAMADASGARAASAVLRDARVDRYLSAHRRVSNAAAMVVPGAMVRNVDSRQLEDR